MNIKKILFFLSLSLLFAACSDSDSAGTDIPVDNGETKRVFLKISTENNNGVRSGNSLRSDEPTQTGQTAELLTALIYFVDGSPDPVIFATRRVGNAATDDITMAQLTEGYEFEDIPSSVEQVYIVGNYNSVDANGNTPSFPTTAGQMLSQVRAVGLNIEQVVHGETADGQTSTGGRLLTVMDGIADVYDYDTQPGNWNGDEDPLPAGSLYANVTIEPINARLEIVQITYTGTAVNSMNLEGIYVNYYYQSVPLSLNYGGLTLTNNGSNVNNYDRGNMATYAYSGYPSMTDEINEDVTITGGTHTFLPANGTWAYHVFGETQTVPHIVLKFTDVVENGTNAGTRYVTVSGYRNAGADVTTFQRNFIYKIANLTITDDDLEVLPETETVNIWVHVEVLGWTTVNVTPVI